LGERTARLLFGMYSFELCPLKRFISDKEGNTRHYAELIIR